MNCILDSHAFLWSLFKPELLGDRAVRIVREPDHRVFVGAVTLRDISPKYSPCKLELSDGRPRIFRTARRRWVSRFIS